MSTTSTTEWYSTRHNLRILSCGDRVRRGTYKIHSRFRDVLNFSRGNYLVSLVTEKVGGGPANIVLKGGGLPDIDSLTIAEKSVVFRDYRIGINRRDIYHSGIDFRSVDAGRFEKNLSVSENLLPEMSPAKSLSFLLDRDREEDFSLASEREFVRRMKTGVDKIFNGSLVSGVETIRGTGFGLTPSGDDFLCGMLYAMNLIRKACGKNLGDVIDAVYANSTGENIISNSFLYFAKEGCFYERFKSFLLSVLYGTEPDICRFLRDLVSVGETSGADAAAGFLLAMKNERSLLWS